MWKRLVTLTAILFLLVTANAYAGGPTSVIIVDPGTGKTAALYTNDKDYGLLMDVLGPRPPVSDGPDLHGGPGSSAINVTWLIHDAAVWRIDRVFLDDPAGPWVETAEAPFSDSVSYDQHGVVHRALNPTALRALLASLLKTKEATLLPANVLVPPTAAPPAPKTGLQWGSLLAGVAVGMLVVVGAVSVRRAMARR
jgi:hypothetical protein